MLVSPYLMYRDLVTDIGAACLERKIPVLLGGPYFAAPEVSKAWLDIPGLAGIAVGEVEAQLPDIVRTAAKRRSLEGMVGVAVPGQAYTRAPPPVKDLNTIPHPDYSDFPWDAYPNRIAPLITGRGCGWGKCSFCSDITSTIGRTYRSRGLDNVLEEVRLHAERYNTKLFVFTDLKLNSDQSMWKGLHKNMQRVVPGAQWVCAIHIPANGGGSLSQEDLKDAAAAGLVRLTTGFESGSMKVLEAMNKGTNLHQMSQTLKNADAAGISVRVTMIVGYPGETAEDVIASARYLEDHVSTIERVMFNRLQMTTGTILHRSWQSHPSRYPDLKKVKPDHRLGQLEHEFKPAEEPGSLAAIDRLLAAVHQINLKPLKPGAQQFEGVM